MDEGVERGVAISTAQYVISDLLPERLSREEGEQILEGLEEIDIRQLPFVGDRRHSEVETPEGRSIDGSVRDIAETVGGP